MNELIEQIRKFITVVPDLESELRIAFEKRGLKKKTLFIGEGQSNVSLGFIEFGALRCYHLKDDSDITNDFFFENTFVTDYESFLKGIPARRNFEAIENARLFSISRETLFKLSERFPELKAWGGKMAESLFSQSLDAMACFKSDSPEERYNRILIEKPEIINRISLHYIASWLGITQVHLSRIRNKKT
jgi:CRP-like cAMP-binding protein